MYGSSSVHFLFSLRDLIFGINALGKKTTFSSSSSVINKNSLFSTLRVGLNLPPIIVAKKKNSIEWSGN